MIDKSIYFLAGLPRTGSTLLGSILAQNENIYVTPTSPLYPLLVSTNEQFNLLNVQYTFDQLGISDRVYHSIVKAFYADIKQPIIFDKHRGWPKHVPAIGQYLNKNPKIICTVRPIAEIITSYLVLAEKDENNFIDAHLKKDNKVINNEERALLLWNFYLKSPYETLKEGLVLYPQNILLVEYQDIVLHPQEAIKKVYDFCGLEAYPHEFNNIENKCVEAKDEAWGLKDLHTIRKELNIKSRNPTEYLSEDMIKYFNTYNI